MTPRFALAGAATALAMTVAVTPLAVTVAVTPLAVTVAPPAAADTGCGPGGPPPAGPPPGGPPQGAASKPVGDVYGQPATLWLTNTIVGITTAQGYGEADIHSASPIQRRALLINAQQDDNHQIIIDAGRTAVLYTVSGCTITTVVDQQGAPLRLDIEHRMGQADGYGCSDLGNGPHLVQLLRLRDNGGLAVRRTEIDLNGATATFGRSDTVTASSEQDPAWTTAGTISCGDLTIQRDGLSAPD